MRSRGAWSVTLTVRDRSENVTSTDSIAGVAGASSGVVAFGFTVITGVPLVTVACTA